MPIEVTDEMMSAASAALGDLHYVPEEHLKKLVSAVVPLISAAEREESAKAVDLLKLLYPFVEDGHANGFRAAVDMAQVIIRSRS